MTALRDDPELMAIHKIEKLLGTLPADGQSRVLAYVQQRMMREYAPSVPQSQHDWPVRRDGGEG